MLRIIDNFLNKITMYRLVLYYLLVLVGAAAVLGFLGLMPYNPAAIFSSVVIIGLICWAVNTVFSYVFEAPTNFESAYITALILVLIINPPIAANDTGYFILAIWASVWAMASKYIFAINKKHIFNPVAFAVALTAITINQSANWWVGGSAIMIPFVLAGGFLVARKVKRFDLVTSFFVVAMASIMAFGFFRGSDVVSLAKRAILDTPLLFFALVMLTEPLTTPPTKILRIVYGVFVGFIFVPAVHIGSIYSTPELALLAGNLFAYLVSPKERIILRLKGITAIAADTYDFIFESDRKLKFIAGQYLEWTLSHKRRDSRGNRRYFTISSSPTESEITIGVKFYPGSSSFKTALAALKENDIIVASQLAGDFTLPKDRSKKLTFIAGGIGITPFRSMIKYLLDTNEPRAITLFYSVKNTEDIAYKDVFEMAGQQLGIKTIYALTDLNSVPDNWQDEKGFIDGPMIIKHVPDYRERFFYISGPHSMVTAFEDTLRKIGVPKNHIKIDFFPGFA